MGTHSHHLTLEDRCDMARLHAAGRSLRHIAATLDRPPSTVARELKRNRSHTQGYQPGSAEQQARARRWRGAKLACDALLRTTVLTHLQQGWTPEQVVGRFARDAGRPVISHETIYRFLYAQIARTKTYAWRHYLPHAKATRGRRRTRRRPAALMAHRRPLADRPAAAADRQTPGHWEADLMLFRTYGQAGLTLHERTSRLLLAVCPQGKAVAPIAHALTHRLPPVPPHGRQTVTFDHGTEFASHHYLHARGIETLFCDRYAPWQKGGVENAIGRLRRTRPRKTDLATLSDQRVHHLVHAYNHTPRKCFGYARPAEIFIQQVVHLKCESTSRGCIFADGGKSKNAGFPMKDVGNDKRGTGMARGNRNDKRETGMPRGEPECQGETGMPRGEPECQGGAGMPRGEPECQGGAGMSRGSRNVKGEPECQGGAGMPRGSRNASRIPASLSVIPSSAGITEWWI